MIEVHGLTIAGVQFLLKGLLDVTALPCAFQEFLGVSSSADLVSEVHCLGADEALNQRPQEPGNPWSFTVREGICEIIRRKRSGETLWRIAGPITFEHASVSWNPLCFPPVYGSFERALGMGLGLSLLVLRLRAQGGLVLHGTAAEVDGQGILCVGVSGKGKSTLACLLDAAGANVLTDERPVLRQWTANAESGTPQPEAFRVYGSPWPSSAGFARDAWVPLRRIYFLEHGETDRLTPLTPRDAVSRLIQVVTFPWQDPVLLDPYLATVDTLLRAIPCSVLSFLPSPAVVDMIRRDLSLPRLGRAETYEGYPAAIHPPVDKLGHL